MIRYHVTSFAQINAIGHFGAISSVSIGDRFRSIIDVDDADTDDLEELMEACENVISYKAA
jgi:2-phospho-L-lactate guanylyltransferase (CobY/MobA/RfbA family)